MSPSPTVELIMGGRSSTGPVMHDGFIQGSRFLFWDRLFAMETICRPWRRTLFLNDVSWGLTPTQGEAGIEPYGANGLRGATPYHPRLQSYPGTKIPRLQNINSKKNKRNIFFSGTKTRQRTKKC